MTQIILNASNRLRRSPTFERVRAAGAKAYSVYNKTLIGQWFGTMEEDYAHLKSAVQVWDVGGERVVEVAGPDAQRLIQMTTPRDLSVLTDDQCAYIPMVDPQGGMLNDPVLTRLADDRYWLALADSDMLLYLKGLAAGLKLDTRVFEPDVWILAVQGPSADELIAKVFGEAATRTRFFRYTMVELGGKWMVLARSGWSVQGGFELYVDGSDHAGPIWDRLMEAGRGLDVRAGCPNLIERIEGGLLSYGNDMSVEHTPFEAGLGRSCTIDRDTGCLGHAALVAAREPQRQIRPVEIAGAKVPVVAALWPLTAPDGQPAGTVSSAAWSPEQQTNVAIAMVGRAYWTPGTELAVQAPDGERPVLVKDRFWGRKSA
ncbi:MAG: dimethylsulfoniopropionate demethylase [Paracoccaceae bacterium]|nr:dimethylsulfoniopropionate demethylase [Paracoccaceae bacterium]